MGIVVQGPCERTGAITGMDHFHTKRGYMGRRGDEGGVVEKVVIGRVAQESLFTVSQ